jgi:hypothetical protein
MVAGELEQRPKGREAAGGDGQALFDGGPDGDVEGVP